jgi:N-acetylmuramic acid 6-phosphate (MurNAc-6-P) etherase
VSAAASLEPASLAARAGSPTEDRHPGTLDIDVLPTRSLLGRLNDEDATVADAVRQALQLSRARLAAARPVTHRGKD